MGTGLNDFWSQDSYSGNPAPKTGGGGMDPVTGLAAASIGVGLVDSFMGMLGGGSKDENRLKYSVEHEIQLIKQFEEQLQMFDQDIERATKIEQAYDMRFDAIDKWVSGTMPQADVVKQMQTAANQLALAAGDLDKAKGFLSDDDYQDIQNLRKMESQDFRDPRLENELSSERAALEQDLARKGITPAQRLNALNEFNRIADERRFTRAEELRTGTTSRTLARLQTTNQMRQQNLQQGFNMLSGRINESFGQVAMGSNILNSNIQGRSATTALKYAGVAARQSAWGQLGQTALSQQTRALIREGDIGPGGKFQQAGIDPSTADASGNYRGLKFDTGFARNDMTAANNAQRASSMEKLQQHFAYKPFQGNRLIGTGGSFSNYAYNRSRVQPKK